MRQIVRVVGKVEEIIDECQTLEEALELLELNRVQANEGETFHIGYDSVTLDLEDWEKEWIKLCEEEDREMRAALAEYRANGGLYFDEFSQELEGGEEDTYDREPSDEELETYINEKLFYYDTDED